MNIKGRFYCESVRQCGLPWGDSIGAVTGKTSYEEVVLCGIYGSSPDDPNKSFADAMPSAKVEMTICSPAAIGEFKPGHIYDLMFTPAPEREPVR